MDNAITPPFMIAPNFPPYLNEIHNFSSLSHLAAPILNSYSHLPYHYNNDSTMPEMEFCRTSTLQAVEKTTKLLHMDRQSNVSFFHQMGSQQQAPNIGFAPWVAPKQDGVMLMVATPRKGQLLLKKCLLKMLPWMRHVNNPKHGGRGDVNLGFHVVSINLTNNVAMSYSNDAMSMYGNCSSTNTITIGQQNEAARHHSLAERTRRQKQKECLRALQVLLPENPKKDKVSILNSTIKHIKKLKNYNKNLEKYIKELQSSTLVLKSRLLLSSSSSMQHVREKGGNMSTNTNIPGFASIASTDVRVIPSPKTITTSSHYPHIEHDLHHETTSISTTSISINTTLQSDHSLSMHVLASNRLSLGSNQLIKVLMCLKDLFLEVLSIQSTFEGDIFMAQISARANKGSSFCETEIKDSLMNAFLSMDSSNQLTS